MTTPPTFKVLGNLGFCRVCDMALERKRTPCVSWYSGRNRGQNIHICVPCVKLLGKLVEENEIGKDQTE